MVWTYLACSIDDLAFKVSPSIIDNLGKFGFDSRVVCVYEMAFDELLDQR